MDKLYTKYNKLSLGERKKVNFFIRMTGYNSNNIKIIELNKDFSITLGGVFSSIRKSNIHQVKCYKDNKLKYAEDFKARNSTFRSVESSYKMFLGYYEKKHNKKSIIEYFKSFIEFKYLIYKSIYRYANNDMEKLKSLYYKHWQFPCFLFCPDINKAVIGINTGIAFFQEMSYSVDSFRYLNYADPKIKHHYNNIKYFLNSYENKDYKALESLLLNDTGFNLIWNYSGSKKKLKSFKYMKKNNDTVFINKFNLSFISIIKKSIKSI